MCSEQVNASFKVYCCVSSTSYLLRQMLYTKRLFSFSVQPLVAAKIAAEYTDSVDDNSAPPPPSNANLESSDASLTNKSGAEVLTSTSELINKVKSSNREKELSGLATRSSSSQSGGLVVYNPSFGRVGKGKQVQNVTTNILT